jgi:aldehyde dehydrogenase (NAD+)
MEKSA